MGHPIGAVSGPGGRHYLDPGPPRRKLPSATTVLNMYAKPNLVPWYAKMAGLRAVGNMAELSRRIRLDGAENAAKWLAAAARESRDEAAILGSDLHDLADRHQKGEELPRTLTDDTKELLEGYEKFLSDFRVNVLFTELSLLNPDDGYGGCADVILAAEGYGVVLGDWKTSGTGPWREWALQLAAYTRGRYALTRDGTTEEIKRAPFPEVRQDVALIIRVLRGTYELHEAELTDQMYASFLGLLEAHRFKAGPEPFVGPVTPEHVGWMERARQASTHEQLWEEYQAARAAGAWDQILQRAWTRRKTELLVGTRPRLTVVKG